MGVAISWRLDLALNDYSLTASNERLRVCGPSGRVCNEILNRFRVLEPGVKEALAHTDPAIASAVLVVTLGVPSNGQDLFTIEAA
jgi:hypothetical protein